MSNNNNNDYYIKNMNYSSNSNYDGILYGYYYNYNHTSGTLGYKIETAEDHPLIKTLDKILGVLIKIVDKSSDWITNLELKIIAKRKKKDKKKFIRKFFNHKKN